MGSVPRNIPEANADTTIQNSGNASVVIRKFNKDFHFLLFPYFNRIFLFPSDFSFKFGVNLFL